MNVTKNGSLAAIVLALTSFTGRSWAEEPRAPATPEEFAKALTEAGKPSSEHAKLQPLAGSWSYTCKMWMDPSKPPMETKGTIERKWIGCDRHRSQSVYRL